MVSVPTAHAYEIKVTLTGIQPPIWRRIQVPGTILLCCLHDALQAAFGWTNSHLHQFEKDGASWSVPDWFDDGDIEPIDESRVSVNRVLKAEGDSMQYLYDFGDHWQHEVLLERILIRESAPVRCLGGRKVLPSGGRGWSRRV
jgi:hypothetical protein